MISLLKRLVKGEPLTAEEHDANLDAIEGAANRERSRFFAGIVGNTSGVNVGTAGTFVRLPSPWAEPQDPVDPEEPRRNFNVGFELQGQDIVCTDETPRVYHITAAAYVDDGQNVTALVRIAKNGVGCTLCAARVTIPSQERPAGETTQTIVQLVAGDIITLQGTRVESSGTLVLEDASIVIKEL
jgi:hypothetical protein